jgi:hypothetical protein
LWFALGKLSACIVSAGEGVVVNRRLKKII